MTIPKHFSKAEIKMVKRQKVYKAWLHILKGDQHFIKCWGDAFRKSVPFLVAEAPTATSNDTGAILALPSLPKLETSCGLTAQVSHSLHLLHDQAKLGVHGQHLDSQQVNTEARQTGQSKM